MFETTVAAFGEKTVTRRTFLRGSGLLAVSLGLAFATPGVLQAQEDATPKQEDPSAKNDEQELPATVEAPPETKIDSHGVPYRDCPECGSKMYKEGRTWLCEACGYSYEE